MDSRITEFIAQHSEEDSPDLANLLDAIREGAVNLINLSTCQSSVELARAYHFRGAIASDHGQFDKAVQFEKLSQLCNSNGDDPTLLWIFEGSPSSYAVFELLPGHTIAGCLEFTGPFERPSPSNA